MSCSDGPLAGGASIRLIDRSASTDTVLALPGSPVVVEARGEDGRPAAGVVVRFLIRASDPDDPSPHRGAYVCGWSQDRCATFAGNDFAVTFGVDVVTDDRGRAQARLQFGTVAGGATLEVSQPGMTAPLLVHYTTLPGALAQVAFAFADTAVLVGSTYALGAHAADRFGNPLPDPVTLTSLSAPVAVVNGTSITAVGIGRGTIRAQAGSVFSDAFVSVPPAGRLVGLAWSAGMESLNQLTLVNTDGSQRRAFLTTIGVNTNALPTWTPDGANVVIQAAEMGAEGQLRMVDTLGGTQAFLANPGVFARSLQPSLAGEEAAIYFYGTSPDGDGVFRADADGGDATFLFAGVQPGPAPDGTRVAYVAGDSLFVRDMGSGVSTSLAIFPVFPRWSPAGDLIAHVNTSTGRVIVMRPDGSEMRELSPEMYDNQVAWSPDGHWLAAARLSGPIEIIRVSDGVRLPIAGTLGMQQLSWRP